MHAFFQPKFGAWAEVKEITYSPRLEHLESLARRIDEYQRHPKRLDQIGIFSKLKELAENKTLTSGQMVQVAGLLKAKNGPGPESNRIRRIANDLSIILERNLTNQGTIDHQLGRLEKTYQDIGIRDIDDIDRYIEWNRQDRRTGTYRLYLDTPSLPGQETEIKNAQWQKAGLLQVMDAVQEKQPIRFENGGDGKIRIKSGWHLEREYDDLPKTLPVEQGFYKLGKTIYAVNPFELSARSVQLPADIPYFDLNTYHFMSSSH